MKVSAKYRRTLDTYLEWEHVRTPASGSFQERKMRKPEIYVKENGLTAAEALCTWESTGCPCSVRPDEKLLLDRYIKGKAQRDWWTKEIAWWSKNASFIPEEFLHLLSPLPFIELFGREPIIRLVRYYYDNHYSLWEFRLDALMQRKVGEWGMTYFERDDRDSALRNMHRILRVRYIDPAIYRVKRRFLAVRNSSKFKESFRNEGT